MILLFRVSGYVMRMILFSKENSKQKDGAIGILTKGLIGRINYYKPAIILALIPIIKKDFF